MANSDDPEWMRAEIARLRASADQREKLADQYRALKKASTTKMDVQQPVQNLVDVRVQQAMGQNPPDPGVQALFPQQLTTLPPDEAADLARRGVQKGAFSTQNPNTPITRNIEGALAQPGSKEIIGGDQRVVVDAQGNARAARSEFPPLGEHLSSVNGEGAGSKFGFFLNAIQAPSRVAATGANLISDVMRGRPTPGPVDSAKELGEAFMNTKGHTVGEGGHVTTRGSGFGDLLRARAKMLLERNPDATVGDLVGAGPLYGPLMGLGTKIAGGSFPEEHPLHPSRRLADVDLNDPSYDFGGEIVALGADPMNFVPADKALAPVGKVVGKAAEAIAPHVPQGVADAARAVNEIPSTIGRLFTGAGKSERTITKGMEAVGESPETAKMVGEQVATAKERVRAEDSLARDEKLARLRKAAPDITSKEFEIANALQEGKGAPVVAAKPLEEQLEVLADAGAKHFDGLPSKEQELLRPVIRARAQGAKQLEPFASRELSLSTHEIAERLRKAEPHILDRMFQPHSFDTLGEAERRQVGFARKLVHEDAILRQRSQRAGVLADTVRGVGHRPRPPSSTEGEFLRKAGLPEKLVRGVERNLDPLLSRPGYDPFKSREMADLVDADIVRRAADATLTTPQGQAAILNRHGQQGLDIVREMARSGEAQADTRTRQMARAIIENTWARKLPEPERSLGEAQGMVRKRGVDVAGFDRDPIMAHVTAHQAASPRVMNAEIGQRMLSVVDEHDRPVVQSLDEALHNPRAGAADAAILKRRYDAHGMRKAGQFWQQTRDGRAVLPGDVASFLKDRGLKFMSDADAETSAVVRAMPALKNRVIPEPVFRDLKDTVERMTPGLFERVAGIMGKITNWWAPIVLNTPGFHTRNAFFGMFQCFLANGADVANTKIWRLAGDVGSAAEHNALTSAVFKYNGKEWRVADLAAEARSFGIFEGGRAADLERAARGKVFYGDEGLRSFLGKLNPTSDRGLVGDEQFFKQTISRGMGGVMSGRTITAENAQRLFTYLNHRVNLGEGASEAAKAVVKYHFDYTGSRLTKMEKGIRKMFPFYQWVKQSSVLLVEQMLRRPDKFAAVNHLYEAFSRAGEMNGKNVDPRMHPSYVDEIGGVHAGDDDERQFWLSMERPGTQLSWAQPGSVALGLASQLAPAPKFAAERFSGRSMFGDRPVDKNFRADNASPLEYVFGMNQQNIPSYVARNMVGGIPGTLVNDVILPELWPEYSNQTAKTTGVDSKTRLAQRVLSMAIGPRLSPTRPLDVVENNRAQWRDLFDARVGAAKERNQRKAAEKPLDFLLR